MSFDMALDSQMVSELTHSTYAEVAARHKVSRGRVWRAAVEAGALKNGMQRRQLAAAWKQERVEILREVTNAVTTADVLDFLGGIPDDVAALHCTSFPYGIGKSYGGNSRADTARLGFYIGWAYQVLAEMVRTVMPGGVLFLQLGSTKDDGGVLYPLDILFFEFLRSTMGMTYQTRIMWEVPHGLTPKGRPSDRYETALVFSKGPVRFFNPTPLRMPQKHPSKRAFKGPNKGNLSGHPLGAWPSNVWKISSVRNDHPERTGHPCQFPEEIPRRAIMGWTQPGDLVMDVFSGSGTTQVQSVKTGRNFAGTDIYYADLRKKRLAAVVPDLVSSLPGITEESMAVWQAEAVPVFYDNGGNPQHTLAL